MTGISITIVIATYRRAAMLRDTVLSLRSMTVPEQVAVEVLVVDNDPEGSAGRVAAELSDHCAEFFELRYVSEPRVGVSFARNRGIDEAHGDVVAFVDDDVFVDDKWLVAMLECLERTGAGAVGGRVDTAWEGEPHPLVRAWERRLSGHDWGGDHDFRFLGRSVPVTCNLVIRLSALAGGLRFSTNLGRFAGVPLSGEDTELMLRLRRKGHAVWYCAGAMVRHRVGGERLAPAYFVRRNFWFGCSYATVDRQLHGRIGQVLNACVRFGKVMAIDVPRLSVAWLRRDAAGMLIARCSLAKQAGYLYATFRVWPAKIGI